MNNSSPADSTPHSSSSTPPRTSSTSAHPLSFLASSTHSSLHLSSHGRTDLPSSGRSSPVELDPPLTSQDDIVDLEDPLGGRWDLAAHWHVDDYSTGMDSEGDMDPEGDADEDQENELGSDIFDLDLARVQEILSSSPSSTPILITASLPSSSSRVEIESFADSIHSILRQRSSRDSGMTLPQRESQASTPSFSPPLSLDMSSSLGSTSQASYTPGDMDNHPEEHPSDPTIPPPSSQTSQSSMGAVEGRSSLPSLDFDSELHLHSSTSDPFRTWSTLFFPSLSGRTREETLRSLQTAEPTSSGRGRTTAARIGTSSSIRTHLSPYQIALERHRLLASSPSLSSLTSSPAMSSSSSRLDSPVPDSDSNVLPPHEEEESARPPRTTLGGTVVESLGLDRSSRKDHKDQQEPRQHHHRRRIVSTSISSLPSFMTSVFVPSAVSSGGSVDSGLYNPSQRNHPRRPCCFLQPGQQLHGTQNLKSRQPPLDPDGASTRQVEQWDVKVVISAVDYDAGVVFGLMEAKDVPMSPLKVVTFWEGEIIDFENHTLWTQKWSARPGTDLEHWKRLEAFRGVAEMYIVRGAKTGKFVGHIRQKYIFMRWKEKHFVNACQHTSGLTIAGFYYISMRRSDGFVEGYYHDQQSTPFQYLCLQPTYAPGGYSSSIFEVA